MTSWNNLPYEITSYILNINKNVYLNEIKLAHKNKFKNVLDIFDIIHDEMKYIDDYIILKVQPQRDYILTLYKKNNKKYRKYIQEIEFYEDQV